MYSLEKTIGKVLEMLCGQAGDRDAGPQVQLQTRLCLDFSLARFGGSESFQSGEG